MNWQKNVVGVLGIWIIFLAFIGFSGSLHKILLVLTGVSIVLVSFFGKKFTRTFEEHVD